MKLEQSTTVLRSATNKVVMLSHSRGVFVGFVITKTFDIQKKMTTKRMKSNNIIWHGNEDLIENYSQNDTALLAQKRGLSRLF